MLSGILQAFIGNDFTKYAKAEMQWLDIFVYNINQNSP